MMWAHSFISLFKKALLFAGIVIVVVMVMDYLYVDDTTDFSRYMMHEFYEQEENIDRVYIGSSHVFCDINPTMLDTINGDNNFNLASDGQQLIASYYLLREANKKHNIKQVYLDLYYNCTTPGIGSLHSPDSFQYSWGILNQMRPSFNKLSYIVNLSEPRYYYLSFLPFMRYRDELFHGEYITGVVQAKQTETWKNHEHYRIKKMEEQEYVMQNAEKGFMDNDAIPETGGFCEQTEMGWPMLTENPITDDSMEYLLKIIDYCEKHNIKLTWINCPITDYQLMQMGSYDNYVKQMKELSAEYHIAYYDFSLCKREYLDLSSNQYWFDKGHLNTAGAEVFTQFLGEFLRAEENGEDTYADCFYDNYAEKAAALEEKIFGLDIMTPDKDAKYLSDVSPETWDEYVIYQIHPVTNAKDGEVEIHVWQTPWEEQKTDYGRKDYTANEEMEIIRDGNDGYVIVHAGEKGSLYIETKLVDSNETKNWAEIELK